MSKQYEKGEIIFDSWIVDSLIGEGSFGRVYKVSRKEFNKTYHAAIKIINIPNDKTELKQAFNDGMSEKEVRDYFRTVTEDFVNEVEMMYKFKGVTNIVNFDDHKVIEKEDEIGFEIIIKMELLTPLDEYCANKSLSRNEIIKIGIDICKALEHCRKLNVIHRDIKPDNIFVSKLGDYKLGDFGVARMVEKTTSGMSKKGTYLYMAPEIYNNKPYNASVDLYSLGIVLYRLLNNNRTPFLPDYPEAITYSAKEKAQEQRMKGDKIPKPANAKDGLGEAILKACAYNPKQRYTNAKEFRDELQKHIKKKDKVVLEALKEESQMQLKNNSKTNAKDALNATVSIYDDYMEDTNIEEDKTVSIHSDSVKEGTISIKEETALTFKETKENKVNKLPNNEKKDSKKKKVILLTILLLLIVIPIILFSFGKDKNKTNKIVFIDDLIKMENNTKEKLKISDNDINRNELRWESSDKKIATISKNGTVEAKSTGTVEVKMFQNDKVLDTIKIEIVEKVIAVENLTLNKGAITLEVGASETLEATISPENASNKEIKWTSENVDIAIVTNGKIEAVAEGTTKVRATLNDEKIVAECNITVKAKQKPAETSNNNQNTTNNANQNNNNNNTNNIPVTPPKKTKQWRYRDKETTTSTSKTLSGWTYERETSDWGQYGQWSGWSTTVYTKTDTRNVETQQAANPVTYYTQYNWIAHRCMNSAGYVYIYSSAGSCPYGGWSPKTFYASTKYNLPNSVTVGGLAVRYDAGSTCNSSNTMGCWVPNGTQQVANPTTYRTEYRYQDRSRVYTYYFWRWKEWSAWQNTEVQKSSTREVETREI